MIGLGITIRPPWSWAIAETAALRALGVEPKTIENRGRRVAERCVGQDLAIHAGLTWCEAGGADERIGRAWRVFADGIGCCRDEPHPALAAIGDRRHGCVGHSGKPASSLWVHQGAVVAVATLVDCHEADRPAMCCRPWGEATHNGKPAWHLVLDNVRRLRHPVSAKGSLAVPWTLPDKLAAAVEREVVDR